MLRTQQCIFVRRRASHPTASTQSLGHSSSSLLPSYAHTQYYNTHKTTHTTYSVTHTLSHNSQHTHTLSLSLMHEHKFVRSFIISCVPYVGVLLLAGTRECATRPITPLTISLSHTHTNTTRMYISHSTLPTSPLQPRSLRVYLFVCLGCE